MSGPGRLEAELAAALERMLAGVPGAANGEFAAPFRPTALGWATVELDRAARELGRRVPGSGPFEPAPEDELLGARCLVGPLFDLGGGGLPSRHVRLVLLEPSTEGRLAATLARHGEGPAAAWLDRDRPPRMAVSRPALGPFGRERLLLGGPLHGPHLLVTIG